MFKKIFVILCLTSLMFAQVASATFVTVNPESNVWDSKKLAELIKTGKTLKDQLDQVKKMVSNLEGNLKRGTGSLDDLRRNKQKLAKILPALYKTQDPNVSANDTTDVQWIEEQVDEIYGTSSTRSDAEKKQLQRKAYEQRAMKSAILNAEETIASTQSSIDRIEDLAGQVDETMTQKDATDLNNRLLVEILSTQNKIIVLLAQMSRVEALAQFSGVSAYEGAATKTSTRTEDRRKLNEKGSVYWRRSKQFEGKNIFDGI